MKPSQKMIRSELKKLELIIKTTNDVVENRIAYAVRENLRWATEDTTDWDPPSVDVITQSKILKDELKLNSPAS